MVSARVELNKYANTVLNVMKAKYDLKNKSEALNKFVELFGDNIVDKEVDDKYIKKILDIENKHFEKYGYRSRTVSDLKKEIEGK